MLGQIKNYKDAIENVFKIEETTKYNLDNIKKWVKILWNPQNNFKIIHIAGTNGKGSVSRMLFSVLKNAWKNVGVFTSPHLIDVKERFETNFWNIGEEEFVEILNRILSLGIELSFFDKCVLIAFGFFRLHKCEYVILEVWLWWKLDTTNIVTPIATTITSIWLDHQNILWNTLEEISEQKAWIIKPWVPIFLNFRNEIIEKTANENKSEIIFVDKIIDTNLLWDFQKKNAGLAYEIAKYLWISELEILNWLQKVRHRWRLEFIKDNLLVDWAHNIDWLKELKKYIDQNLKDKFENIFYCFSLKKWKTPNLVTDIFGKKQNYILLDIDSNMLFNVEDYRNMFLVKDKNYIFSEVEKNPQNLYLVFWSLYMIWEFLKI